MENGRIVGIGGANVDFHAQSRAPLILRDSNPGFARITAGGVTRNILENLARMGDRVSLISAVGDDLFGSFILSESREAGIDMDAVLRCPGHSSSCYAAIMDERGDMFLGMSDMRILEQLTDEIILERMSRFNDVDCVVTDPNLPESTLDWLLGGALERADYEWAAAALGFLRPQWWQEHEDHRALENALLKTRTLASKKE